MMSGLLSYSNKYAGVLHNRGTPVLYLGGPSIIATNPHPVDISTFHHILLDNWGWWVYSLYMDRANRIGKIYWNHSDGVKRLMTVIDYENSIETDFPYYRVIFLSNVPQWADPWFWISASNFNYEEVT